MVKTQMALMMVLLAVLCGGQECQLQDVYSEYIERAFKPFESGITPEMIEQMQKLMWSCKV